MELSNKIIIYLLKRVEQLERDLETLEHMNNDLMEIKSIKENKDWNL